MGAVLAVSALAVWYPVLSGAQSANSIDLSKYILTFEEEFNSLDVSAWGPGTRWIAHTPWNGDFGDARFVDPRPDFPFTVDRGILRIEARKTKEGRWESGLLASVDPKGKGFSQKYGYFEMRAKLPRGAGLWSAFWLIGIDRSRTTSEVDVLEHYGKFPERFTSGLHVWDRRNPAKNWSVYQRTSVLPGSLYDGFHVFGASLEQDYTRIYLDGKQVWRAPTPLQHRQPFYVLLNLALGGGWPITEAPSPSFMYVDYIRVWQKK